MRAPTWFPAGIQTDTGFLIDININGVWRSWLARTAGGREVAGSSPVTPTINVKINNQHIFLLNGYYEII